MIDDMHRTTSGSAGVADGMLGGRRRREHHIAWPRGLRRLDGGPMLSELLSVLLGERRRMTMLDVIGAFWSTKHTSITTAKTIQRGEECNKLEILKTLLECKQGNTALHFSKLTCWQNGAGPPSPCKYAGVFSEG